MKPAPPPTPTRDRLLDEAVAVLHARGESVAVVQLVHAWAANGVPSPRARLAEGRAFQRLCLLDRAMARAQEALDATAGAEPAGVAGASDGSPASGPEDLQARWLMVDVYLDRGWPLKARKLLTALRDEGHDVDAAWARSLEEPPRPENHAREAEREGDPQRLLALAEAFLRAGSFLRATGLLERVRRLQPANTRAHDLLWALGGEFGGADVDSLVRRAKAFAAASALSAPTDEAEHTETLGPDVRDVAAHDDEAARFPALFKYEGGPSDRTDTDGEDVTAASALLSGGAVPLPADGGRGDTQIMLVIRPGEDAAASASRAAHRRRADAEDVGPVDLRAWQRSMGMGDSDLDGMTDKRLEEEDIERVMVTRAEAPSPEPSAPQETVAPIEVLELVPQPPTAPVPAVMPETVAAGSGGALPTAASAHGPDGQPVLRQPDPTEASAAPEPVPGRGRSGRSLLWAGLAFAGVLGVGLAVLVGVGSTGGSDAAERVEQAMQTEDYARLLEEEGRLERALEQPGAEAALAGIRLALWADFNGDPTRMTAVRALLDRPENVDLHALAVLRAATALAQEDVAGALAALGREVPQNDEERFLFARIAATGGDAERALAHLDAITATDAHRYQLGRARVLAGLGRREEAVALVDGVLAAHPGDFSAEVLRLELTDVPAAVAPKAADLLSRARALRSSGAPIAPRLEGRVHAAYARALVALGAPPDEVRDMISSGLAHDGTNPDLLYLLAADDTARGRLTTALADLQVVLEGRRGHVAARTASVLVLLDLDRVEAAAEIVTGFGTDARSAAAAAASRALVEAAGRGGAVDAGALDAGAVSRWARALAAAQANAPDAAQIAADAVDALTASRDPFERRLLPRARALRATLSAAPDPAALGREVIDASPDDPYVHVLVARMYEAAGQRARAAVHFDRAAELGPELGLAWYEKGRFYMDAGDNFLRTGAAWRNYLSLAPTGPRATRAEDTLAVR